jgi:hypothetical protein
MIALSRMRIAHFKIPFAIVDHIYNYIYIMSIILLLLDTSPSTTPLLYNNIETNSKKYVCTSMMIRLVPYRWYTLKLIQSTN